MLKERLSGMSEEVWKEPTEYLKVKILKINLKFHLSVK